jgi:hypothetical protein
MFLWYSYAECKMHSMLLGYMQILEASMHACMQYDSLMTRDYIATFWCCIYCTFIIETCKRCLADLGIKPN